MSQEAVVKFLKNLDENEAMQKKFSAAVPETSTNAASVVAFASRNGYDFTEEELQKEAKSYAAAKQPAGIKDDDLQGVVGGLSSTISLFGSYSSSLLQSIYSFNFARLRE